MNTGITFSALNKDDERKRALSRIYALLVKLADKKEAPETVKETPALLKNNIPPAV